MADLEAPTVKAIIQSIMSSPGAAPVQDNVVHTDVATDNVVHGLDNVVHTS